MGRPALPPGRLARQLNRSLTPNTYTTRTTKYGIIEAVHTATTTTLSANVTAPSLTCEVAAHLVVNDYIFIGTNPTALQVTAVTGSGPYTLTLGQYITVSASSGATVTRVNTVDLYVNGNTPTAAAARAATGKAGPLAAVATLWTGMRWLSPYSPTVNDRVTIDHPRGSDHYVRGTLA